MPDGGVMVQPVSREIEFRTSEQIGKLAAALAKASASFTDIHKDREVEVKSEKRDTKYTFRYATLANITEATRKHLSDNELHVMQIPASSQRGTVLVTRLMHSSGEWVEACLAIPQNMQIPQQFGSALTYARRYVISSLLNIAADDDDDGNAAEGNTVEAVRDRQRQAPPPPPPRQSSSSANIKAPSKLDRVADAAAAQQAAPKALADELKIKIASCKSEDELKALLNHEDTKQVKERLDQEMREGLYDFSKKALDRFRQGAAAQ